VEKQQLPSRAKIAAHWAGEESEDYLISHCWVCGKRVRSVEQLERHHVTPESLGGTADLDNLFLLCKKCHDVAPSVNDRGLFFSWAENRSEINEVFQEVVEAIKAVDAGENFAKWLNAKKKEEIQGILRGKLTINYTAYGPKVPVIGPLAVLKKEWEEEKNEGKDEWENI